MGPTAREVLRRSRLLRRGVVAARHRGLRPDDFFIASYPRSGNTWIRFLLVALATRREVDFESVDALAPPVGRHRGAPRLAGGGRLIKTHEPYRSQYRRSVYLVRDVRDVLISSYRLLRADPDDYADLDGFVADFAAGDVTYGRWDDHVRSWQAARDGGAEILFLEFEDLRSDPVSALETVAEFAGIAAPGEAVHQVVATNSREAMQRAEMANLDYLRSLGHRSAGVGSGAGGSWRQLLDDRHLRMLEPALRLNAELGYR